MEKNKLHIVLGASNNPERYSYKALGLLLNKGYNAKGVHPARTKIFEKECIGDLSEIKEDIHTLTLYLSAKNQGDLKEKIQELKIQRLIFNPGTENQELFDWATQRGIHCLQACTLVLLNTEQY